MKKNQFVQIFIINENFHHKAQFEGKNQQFMFLYTPLSLCTAACLAMSHDWKFFKGTEWNLGPQGRRKLCKFEFFCTCTRPARFLIFYIRIKVGFVCWVWGSGSLAYPGEGLWSYPVLPVRPTIIVDFRTQGRWKL